MQPGIPVHLRAEHIIVNLSNDQTRRYGPVICLSGDFLASAWVVEHAAASTEPAIKEIYAFSANTRS